MSATGLTYYVDLAFDFNMEQLQVTCFWKIANNFKKKSSAPVAKKKSLFVFVLVDLNLKPLKIDGTQPRIIWKK